MDASIAPAARDQSNCGPRRSMAEIQVYRWCVCGAAIDAGATRATAVQMLLLNNVLAHVARVLVRASPNGNGYGVLRAGRVRHTADTMRASLPGVLFEADTFVACALRWGRRRGAPHDSSETLLR